MQRSTAAGHAASEASNWLKRYYFLRFAVAAIWVAMAFTVAKESQLLAAVLLAGYPAWDAVANILDASRSGGLSRNKSQSLNVLVSLVTAAAVGVALGHSLNAVLAVYGVWAALAGLFQLATAIGRWRRFGAQWVMILSGAQSALAGIFFIKMSGGDAPVGIVNVAPYAAFGAFYFLVSALWLLVADVRRGGDRAAA